MDVPDLMFPHVSSLEPLLALYTVLTTCHHQVHLGVFSLATHSFYARNRLRCQSLAAHVAWAELAITIVLLKQLEVSDPHMECADFNVSFFVGNEYLIVCCAVLRLYKERGRAARKVFVDWTYRSRDMAPISR